MDNAEVSAKAEDALKFMKCEMRASFYFQNLVRTLFRNFAVTRGMGNLVLERAEASVPEDLYKIDVLNGKSCMVIAGCDLREGKFHLLCSVDKTLARENEFIKTFFALCGLKAV